MKIFVVGGATNYARFIENATLTDDIAEADVVLFTGGEDVSPSLYGCKKHKRTFSNLNRDKEESKIFKTVRKDQLCVGICRGSQLMCVLNGGLLVQDCDNHAVGSTHAIYDRTSVYQITSTHHQMQYPYNLDDKDYEILFLANGLCSYYEGDKIDPYLITRHGEPEVVLYHTKDNPKCLAIQGHPEMIPESPVAKMLSSLINKLVNDSK